MSIPDLESRVAAYLAQRDGPLRLERIAARAIEVEWSVLSGEDRTRIVQQMRRSGFQQRNWPLWIRMTPREGRLTEKGFAELVEYANRFAADQGWPPGRLVELAGWLNKHGATREVVEGLRALSGDAEWEAALKCAGYVRVAA